MNEPGIPEGITCPRCGSTNLVAAEDETGHRSRESISLVLLSALLVVGAYFLFLVYAYLAYPLTIMIFTALAGWTIKRKEKRAGRGKPIARHLFCMDCSHLFLHNG